MKSHYLKLNDAKTELMILGAPKDINCVTAWTVTVGENEILPSQSARKTLDATLEMKTHVRNITRSCHFQWLEIVKIRKRLSHTSVVNLCHVFITSRLDNVNSLLFKISSCLLNKLQLAQNITTMLILELNKRTHITPALIELHWLPILERIQYKILLPVYKSTNNRDRTI